jgi:hypothetical protein
VDGKLCSNEFEEYYIFFENLVDGDGIPYLTLQTPHQYLSNESRWGYLFLNTHLDVDVRCRINLLTEVRRNEFLLSRPYPFEGNSDGLELRNITTVLLSSYVRLT